MRERRSFLSIKDNDSVEIFKRKILNYINQQMLQHEINSKENSIYKKSFTFKI